MFKLEPRPAPSKVLTLASPLIALAITVLVGVVMFMSLGKDPIAGLTMFFVEPLKSGYALSELSLKATPLILIALGLSVCFRANLWNIGAEGQFILGAIFAGGVAMRATPETGHWIFVLVLLAGMVGGMVWAAIVALLRDRFNASEILVSLMLVYVAEMLLSYLVYGPWKDPAGYNFPQTITFLDATRVPKLVQGFRLNIGVFVALWWASRSSCSAPLLASSCRWAAWRPRRHATRASRRARRCGRHCCCRAAWRAWRARSMWPVRKASSRPTCRWAMASRPSSWPSWGACTPWASCSRRC